MKKSLLILIGLSLMLFGGCTAVSYSENHVPVPNVTVQNLILNNNLNYTGDEFISVGLTNESINFEFNQLLNNLTIDERIALNNFLANTDNNYLYKVGDTVYFNTTKYNNDLNNYLSLTGGTLSGNLDLNGNNILDVNSFHTNLLNINNQYDFPSVDGLINQTLFTDGAGNLYWGDVSTQNGLIYNFTGDEFISINEVGSDVNLTFNYSQMNLTIDQRINLGNFLNGVATNYLYRVGDIVYFNETLNNLTIDERIALNNFLANTDNNYLYKVGDTVYFNETLNNLTIDERITLNNFLANTDNNYLYKIGDTVYFNTTKYNNDLSNLNVVTNLSLLDDVNTTDILDGQFLYYNQSTGLFQFKNVSVNSMATSNVELPKIINSVFNYDNSTGQNLVKNITDSYSQGNVVSSFNYNSTGIILNMSVNSNNITITNNYTAIFNYDSNGRLINITYN